MLEDTFGRRFHYLRLSITEWCNFRCNYCLPEGNACDTPKDNLSLREVETLVAAFARLGTSKIRITGGEPTLRKDLSDIIAICKGTPGIQTVAMTTNGFNLKDHIGEFRRAGLDAVNVSADSLDPRMFSAITGQDKLQTILEGVELALRSGVSSVKLNTVLLRQYNHRELASFFDFLRDRRVSWRFIELMQTGDNQTFFEQNHVAGEPIKQHLLESGWEQVIRDKRAGPAQEFRHNDYAGTVGLIMPYSKDFCKTCNRLRVSSRGKLHLCLFAEEGLDIRASLTAGDVDATCQVVERLVAGKIAGHGLAQGFTGATRQLAMLGG
ncbi:GTP 3',8-cyclase MoaA [Aestuariibacter halophilus]|uniref:GTP 3',8-cyclase n=1 Tax=Fluctibacter halophilus TaxID=226011 RepID=A0ABS8G4J2_9ALTE|nr:GTP 3',8-cyclase MoaA [Aestuariibacter halophilus]MCC2615056.1 GTP 3',8-cyclase MoaA [Aestuariibacter halophilus]